MGASIDNFNKTALVPPALAPEEILDKMARPLDLQLATDPAFWKPYTIVEVKIDLKENTFFVKYSDDKEEELPIPAQCAERLAKGSLKEGELIEIVNRYVYPELSLPSSLEAYNVQDLQDRIGGLREKVAALSEQRQELKEKREGFEKKWKTHR